MRFGAAITVALAIMLAGWEIGCAQHQNVQGQSSKAQHNALPDSSEKGKSQAERYAHLTDEDFRRVADELGVETAAIKAVVSIEAGSAMKGFWAPGVPVINFDRTMYNRYARTAKSKAGDKSAQVPKGLTGYPLREWTQLVNARRVNAQGADLGTFWGMFQIGGFGYKSCDCESIQEFVRRMSDSEFEQLELFAAFIRNNGMLADLRSRNWAGFSRKYNGPSYARRGYHTKMAAAYKKFREQEQKSTPVKSEANDAAIKGKSLKLNQ